MQCIMYVINLYLFAERVRSTMHEMGAAVFYGGFSTFLAFLLLAASKSYIFKTFFKVCAIFKENLYTNTNLCPWFSNFPKTTWFSESYELTFLQYTDNFVLFLLQIFFCVVFYGLFHGLLFLPVILSWIGPSPYQVGPIIENIGFQWAKLHGKANYM